ncbi:nuclear transport factor 2 family protein [Psychroserpens damuponensis]|uniref:nuclear transport factor 2 family protein n=1 Tax=Psychroserpens damuponensis TaxID=943936 RepID=UPI00058C673E|nr:nuclear transport factor 2 family protein [Psychroserpens damuponensis]
MNDFKYAWNVWCNSWTITNTTERAQELQHILAQNFTYTDPVMAVKGVDQINEAIQQFQAQAPGITFDATHISTHNNRFLVKWNMLNAENDIINEGSSFIQTENNKFKDITGFFEV